MSKSSQALVAAIDQALLIMSVYDDLTEAVAQARKDKKKAKQLFCDAVGMKDDGSSGPGVPPVSILIGPKRKKRSLMVLDGDLWLDAIDAAFEFIADNNGPDFAAVLRLVYCKGYKTVDACKLYPNVSYARMRWFFSQVFRYVVVAEAAARGLVQLKID